MASLGLTSYTVTVSVNRLFKNDMSACWRYVGCHNTETTETTETLYLLRDMITILTRVL